MSSKQRPKLSNNPKDVIKTGPKEVHIDAERARKLKPTVKPTTSRALIVREGKYGLQGAGGLAASSRISGREKLDLLAEDLVIRTRTAVSAPFDIHKCLRIAETQYDIFLGDISNLHDPDIFQNIINDEVEALTRLNPNIPDQKKNASHVAKIITARIHNTYMLAAGWRIVKDTIQELIRCDMTNKNVKVVLMNDARMRNLYLSLFHMVGLMVDIYQNRFSVLALNSPHYTKYFKEKPSDDPTDEPEIIFDHAELRQATMSFIDSIILELCFPKAEYPKFILYQLLQDAAQEAPRDTHRFSQLMWDATGDLSESVELQQLLEVPFLTPSGFQWKNDPLKMPEAYDNWLDAQMLSLRASREIANFKDIIFPLEKATNKVVLNKMWSGIDLNYMRFAGKTIDDLWSLKEALNQPPQWTCFFSTSNNNKALDFPDKNQAPKKRLAITSGYDSSGSMPSLQSFSASDASVSDVDTDSQFEIFCDEDDGYNTEEEDELREMLRSAMDTAHERDWLNYSEPQPEESQEKEEDYSQNPFLKLLSSLKGRLFTSSKKFKVPPNKSPQGYVPPLHKTTVEEVTDEEESQAGGKKKKKKKPKKKKRATTDTITEEAEPKESIDEPTSPVLVSAPATPKPQQTPVSPKVTTTVTPNANKKASTPTSVSSPKTIAPVPSLLSKAAIPSFETATSHAQSTRSYLSSIEPQKVKSKTRSDTASIFSNKEEEKPKKKNRFMSALGFGKKEPVMDEKEQSEARTSWFQSLSKKTEGLMHHLLRTPDDIKQGQGGMKWDDFVKLMTEMGFQHDPSTAGSSVRFTPPGQNDHPISFHKPHPKSYIEGWKLREWSNRLKKTYGWDTDLFMDNVELFHQKSQV